MSVLAMLESPPSEMAIVESILPDPVGEAILTIALAMTGEITLLIVVLVVRKELTSSLKKPDKFPVLAELAPILVLLLLLINSFLGEVTLVT
jgi:hypothetical protein